MLQGAQALSPVGGLVIEAPFPPEVFERNKRLARARRLSTVTGTATKPRLAVVGSGHSLRSHFQELCDFDGDVWAINGAWQWLADHGFEATFFSVDPTLGILPHVRNVKSAVLHAQVDAAVFDQLALNWAAVRLFDPPSGTGGFSATGAAFAAIAAGYKEISFFGCECSHAGGPVHIYTERAESQTLVIDVLGVEFMTRPVYYLQALELAELIRGFPGAMIERSGGLLGAIVAVPVARSVMAELDLSTINVE